MLQQLRSYYFVMQILDAYHFISHNYQSSSLHSILYNTIRKASVFFTIVIYPILLLLEGEEASSSQPKKRRRRRIVQATKPVFGITLPPLPTLRQLSGHYLALGATTSIFVIVSLYAVLLRGLFQSHVSHEDVYHHFYGSTSDGDHDHQSDDHIAKMVQQDHAHSHAVDRKSVV